MGVLGPEEGDSYWQPLPSTEHITAKITPGTARGGRVSRRYGLSPETAC